MSLFCNNSCSLQSQMWISWSWASSSINCINSSSSSDSVTTSTTTTMNKFKDHPVVALFERSNVLSRIEITRLKSKRRLCFSRNDNTGAADDEGTDTDSISLHHHHHHEHLDRLPQVLWECNDLEKLYLSGNAIQQVGLHKTTSRDAGDN